MTAEEAQEEIVAAIRRVQAAGWDVRLISQGESAAFNLDRDGGPVHDFDQEAWGQHP